MVSTVKIFAPHLHFALDFRKRWTYFLFSLTMDFSFSSEQLLSSTNSDDLILSQFAESVENKYYEDLQLIDLELAIDPPPPPLGEFCTL